MPPDRARAEPADRLLDAGLASHGHTDQGWTLERVCALVERYFGVSYSLKGMHLVLHRMGWSAQALTHRAAERDEQAVAGAGVAAREKTADDLGPWADFEDEAGQSPAPAKARTSGRSSFTKAN